MISALNSSILGLQKSSLEVAKSADNIANPQKGTEPVEDIINIKISEQNYNANALVLKTTSEMQKELLHALDIHV